MPLDVIERDTLANATRYDLIRASPDAATLETMWVGWAIIAEISAAACAVVILAILCDRQARASSYNLFVVFVTLPDFLFSFLCGMTCARNAARGGLYSDDTMCEFQAWYCIFGFTASPWLNACIARELHSFLRATKQLQVYTPPPRSRVIKQALCVYAWSAFVASWTLVGRSTGLPHHANAVIGAACLPVEYSFSSSLFFWLCFVPTFIGVPLVYIVYLALHTWWYKLVDTKRSRQSRQALSLVLYFLRIFVVFLIMWGPTIVLIYVIDMHSAWLAWAGGAWSHMQGLVAVLMTLTKRDVADAVVSLLCCGYTPHPMVRPSENAGSTPPVSTSTVWPSGVDSTDRQTERQPDADEDVSFDEVVAFEKPDDGGKLETTATAVLNVVNIAD